MKKIGLFAAGVLFGTAGMKLLGSKGTTGTQASFMELFDGDESKVKELEKRIADDFGFAGVVPVSGQTYSRKVDTRVLNVLAGIAARHYSNAAGKCAGR